jgi:two-component sensor histidine kinase
LRDLGLREAIEAAIEGCGNTLDRFDVSGNKTRVPAGRGTSIVLAIHELCTNSVKYGSLSVPDGRVAVSWGRTPEGTHFAFEWRESGGPAVSPPERQGFGSTLLGRMLEAELGGKVEMDYAPDGFRCQFTIPIPEASERPEFAEIRTG